MRLPLLVAPPLLAALLIIGRASVLPGFLGDWLVPTGLPLFAGLTAATVSAGEHAMELQATLPTSLRTTMCRRIGLIGASALLGLLLLAVGLAVIGADHEPLPRLASSVGLAALLIAIGMRVGLAARSAATASTVVFAAWLGKLLVFDRVITSMVITSIALSAVASLLFISALRTLSEPQQAFGGTEQ